MGQCGEWIGVGECGGLYVHVGEWRGVHVGDGMGVCVCACRYE